MSAKWKSKIVKIGEPEIVHVLTWPPKQWPRPVTGGDEKKVYREAWAPKLPYVTKVRGIWTFIGLDVGDIVEADISVYTRSYPLVLRSMHKEAVTSYDAWQFNAVNFAWPLRRVRVSVLCRAAKNQVSGELAARIHYGVIVIGEI